MRFRRLTLLLSLLVLAGPAFAQTPPPPPPPPSTSAPQPRPGDAFGEEVTLTAKTIVFAKGSAQVLVGPHGFLPEIGFHFSGAHQTPVALDNLVGEDFFAGGDWLVAFEEVCTERRVFLLGLSGDDYVLGG